MQRSLIPVLAMTVLGAFCFTLTAQEGGKPAAGGAFKPVASLDALMGGQKQQLGDISKLLGDQNAKDRLKLISLSAELLAELANVNSYNSEKADYQAWARDLRDTSLALAKDAKKQGAKDEDLKKTIERMKAICQSCHDVYQK